MTKRSWLAIPSVAAAAVVFLLLDRAGTAQAPQPAVDTAYQAPVDVDTARLPGPRQPIFYRHDVHAGQYRMDCRYCHFAAEVSASPGMPTVQTCMGCHIIAGAGNPEVQKLRDAWNERRPIEWVEIHVVAPFVRFPHNRHVRSDSGAFKQLEPIQKCEECHGPVRRMAQVYQHASLKMGWCVDCHEQSQVSTDCTVCHY